MSKREKDAKAKPDNHIIGCGSTACMLLQCIRKRDIDRQKNVGPNKGGQGVTRISFSYKCRKKNILREVGPAV